MKKTNDNYGHMTGDKLICEAGAFISRIFGADCIFRIGGDEFVAILFGETFENRMSLCRKFEEEMDGEIPGLSGLRLSISYGMASYGEDGTEYEALFRAADGKMYEKKKQMKQ